MPEKKNTSKKKMTEEERILHSDAWYYLKIIFPNKDLKYVPLKDENLLEAAWLYAYFYKQTVELRMKTGALLGEVKRELVTENHQLCPVIMYTPYKPELLPRRERYLLYPGGRKVRWS